MLAFSLFPFTIIPIRDLKLTRNATGHMFLRKEQIKIASWD